MGYTSRICWGTPSRTPDEGSLLGYPSQTPHQYRERSYLARGICWGTDSGYVGYIQPDSGYVGIHPSRLQTRDTLGYTQPYQGIVGVHPSRPGLWWGTTTGPGFCCGTTTRRGFYWGTPNQTRTLWGTPTRSGFCWGTSTRLGFCHRPDKGFVGVTMDLY